MSIFTNRFSRKLTLLPLIFTLVCPLYAQDFDPTLEDKRRQDLEDRTNELGSLERRGGAPDPGPAQERFGPCFQINQLSVEGVTLLTPTELANIVKKYVPRCMQGADIQAVMRELDGTYANLGYITAKTYIPPQNLTEGKLLLSMLEGKVEDIFLIDAETQIESKRGARQLETAFPNTNKKLFQLRDFEQGLDQMNRLASVDAVLKLQPGEHPGGSYVIIQRVQDNPVRGFVHLDNQGSKTTGRNNLSFDVEFDDLFGANDTWNFGYSGSENTNALNFSGSVPHGYWTFEGDISYSEYLTPLNAVSELFGRSRNGGVRARYIIQRDQTNSTELSLGLKVRKSDRFINYARLTPQNLTTLTFGVKHLRLGEAARNSYDASLTFGTRILGADVDERGALPDQPRSEFIKLTAGWQRQGAYHQLGTLVTDLRAQITPHHVLYGSEQMSLGSYSTVRGYETSVATGDLGIYVRNDLYLSSDIWSFLSERTAKTLAQNAQPHLFFDLGTTYDYARSASQKAAGFGFGLSYYHDYFTLSGIVGMPLVQNNRWNMGDPTFQFRLDITAF